jgi:nitroreductase
MHEEGFKALEFRTYPEEEMRFRARAYFESMRSRRSVRSFSTRDVPREIIEDCLRTAGSAPSGANRQPWHFVAISEPGLKRRIREAAEEEERAFYAHRAGEEWLDALAPLGTDANKPFLEDAPWLIVVFLKKFTFDEQGRKHKNYYTAESVGIACGFLLTALHWAGLATLTHTPSPMKFLNEVLERPKSERAYMVIPVGYPAAGATVPVITKEPLERIVTFKT